MANVSQTPETPKLGAYETRILGIYPNQDAIEQTYQRAYAGAKMVEVQLILQADFAQVAAISKEDLTNMFLVQQEFLTIVPTVRELCELVEGTYQLKRKREHILKQLKIFVGGILAISETAKSLSEDADFIRTCNRALCEHINDPKNKESMLAATAGLKEKSERFGKIAESVDAEVKELYKKCEEGFLEFFTPH